MVEVRDKAWILLLASAIATIVAVLTPAAMGIFTSNPAYIWLWALNIRPNGDVWFNTDDIALAGAVLETVVLAIAAMFLFLAASKVKKGHTQKGLFGIMFACLLMLFASPVGYIIGAVAWDPWFWTDHAAGFGIIGPFIAAGLVIASYIILKKK
ncbi:MAG: hypothetical protein Q6373_020310 [Candidatus Sigynarchaeota archaeon]